MRLLRPASLTSEPHTRNTVWGKRSPCYSASRKDALSTFLIKNQSFVVLERRFFNMQIYIKFPNYTQTHENNSTPHPCGEHPCYRGAPGIVHVAFDIASLRQGSCHVVTEGWMAYFFRGKIRIKSHLKINIKKKGQPNPWPPRFTLKNRRNGQN